MSKKIKQVIQIKIIVNGKEVDVKELGLIDKSNVMATISNGQQECEYQNE